MTPEPVQTKTQDDYFGATLKGERYDDAVVVSGPHGALINSMVLEKGFYIQQTDGAAVTVIPCQDIEKMMRIIYGAAFQKLVESGVLDTHGRPRMSLEEGYPVMTRMSRQKPRPDKRKHICEMILSSVDLPQEAYLYPVEILLVPIESIVDVIEDPGRRICQQPVHYGSEMTLNMASFVSRDTVKIAIVYNTVTNRYQLEIAIDDIMNRPEKIVVASNTGNMDRFMRDLPPDELGTIVVTIRRNKRLRAHQKRMLTIFRPNPSPLSLAQEVQE